MSVIKLIIQMFKGKINFTIGEPIAINDIEKLPLGHREKAQMISRHLQRIGDGKLPIFSNRKSIIHPLDRQATCPFEQSSPPRASSQLLSLPSTVAADDRHAARKGTSLPSPRNGIFHPGYNLYRARVDTHPAFSW